MRLLSIFLALLLLTGAALAASAPLNKNVDTPIMSDTGTANRLGWISIQTIGNATVGPVVADADRLLNDDATSASAATNNTTFAAQPDYPRSISITPNQAIWAEVKFTGTDIASVAITENITFSNTSAVKSTNRAFKTITKVDYNATKQGFGSTAPKFDVGVSDKLGLNTKLATNTSLLASHDGARVAVPTLSLNATVLSLNTGDPLEACDGKPIKIWYIV